MLLALAAFAVAANAVPPLLTTLAREYGIPLERFGSAFFLQYALFAVASALIAAVTKGRFGEAILVGSLAATSGLFFLGPLLGSFTAMLIWFVPLGLAGGFIETQATILLGREEAEHSSRLVSLSQAFYCAGAIVAPQIVGLLLARETAWELGFLVFALLIGAVAGGAAFALLPRRRTAPAAAAAPLPVAAAVPPPGATATSVPARGAAAPARGGAGSRLVLAAFAAAMFFYVVAEGTLVAWVPAFFEVAHSLTPAAAALGLSVFWAGVLAGRVAVFFLPERFGLWPALLVATAAGTASLVLLSFVDRPSLVFVLVFVSGLLLGPVWPVLVSTGRSTLGSESAVAVIVGAGAVGVAGGPFAASRVIAVFGMERLFFFVAASAFVVTAIVYTLHSRIVRS
jgi:fucose permease